MKNTILLIPLMCWLTLSFSQSIGINEGGSPPNPSALLDINSPNKGLLIPRMSTAQRKAIAAPAAGLLVFDLDKSTIYLFDGEKWQAMLFSNSAANNPPIGRSASNGAAGDKFGASVSISGDYAIVGAANKDIGTKTKQGAAYIFVRQGGTWSQQVILTAADGAANDNFGNSVSISGNYAIVGSPKGSGAWFLQGAAYIFVRNGANWVQQAKLNAADGILGEYFGTSVNISGDNVIVGAPNARVQYANQGAAYVFVRSGASWTQQSKLTVSYGEYNDYFGFSVAINGDYAIIGSPYRDANIYVPDVGAAYVFVRSGTNWTMQEDLYRGAGDVSDFFGTSVSINGSYAVVGAPYFDNAPLTDNGVVYIYTKTGVNWSAVPVKVSAPDASAAAYFGTSVCLSGDTLIVGAYYHDVGSNSAQGAAYIYRHSAVGWPIVRKVDDGGGQTFGLFGSAVAVSGYNYIIGAAGKNDLKGEVSFLNIE